MPHYPDWNNDRGMVAGSGTIGDPLPDRPEFPIATQNAPVPPTWIDYRANPNAGQTPHPASPQGRPDPPFTTPCHDMPNSELAAHIAPQPELPGRGYNMNDSGARPNLMQPHNPTPLTPDPYTGSDIGEWEEMDA